MTSTRPLEQRERGATRHDIALAEQGRGSCMDIRHCQLVLGLLARWAVRWTQKRVGQQADLMKEATLDESKG